MAANGISTLATKQAKQVAKLALAQTKYSGKESTGSLLFSGQDDVIYSPTDSATTIMGVPYITSTSTFTAEARIKLTAYQNGPIIGDASGFTMHWSLLVDTRGGAYSKLTFYWYDSSANAYKRVYGNTSLSLDTWYHVAVSISAGAVKLFVDGVLQTATSEQSNNGFASVTSRAATLTDGPASFGFLTIGSWGNFNSSNSFAGYITNLRISRTARYSTTFTPGTTALTTDANTGLLLLVSSAQYYLDDSSGNLFNMRLSGHGVPDWTADTPITVTANTGLPGYRARSTLDITLLPTTYTGNAVTDNPNDALTLTPGAIRTGVKIVTYTGYHDEDVAFTDTAVATATTTANNFAISGIGNTIPGDPPENITVLYTGYLLATYTGTWTFVLNSDDGSYLWIGSTAVSGYTTSNELVTSSYAGPGTGTISLTAGEYYPIRLLYGNGPSEGWLSLTYAHTGQSATTDFTGKLFSPSPGNLVVGRPWS